MPEINQYGNTETIRPTDMGEQSAQRAAAQTNRLFTETANTQEQAGKEAGRMIGGGIDDLGKEVVAYNDHVQEATIAKQASDIFAGGIQQFNTAVKGVPNPNYDPNDPQSQKWLQPPADPSDPTVKSKFMEGLEDKFDTLRNSATSPGSEAAAERQIDSLRKTFTEHTNSVMGTLAADAGVEKISGFVNNQVNTVTNDPTLLDAAIKNIQSTLPMLAAGNPNMPANASSKIATEGVQNAVTATVHAAMLTAMTTAAKQGKDPEAVANAFLDKYSGYVKESRISVLQYAQNLKGAMLRDQEAQRTWADNQAKDKAYSHVSDLIQTHFNGKETQNPLIDLTSDKGGYFKGHPELQKAAIDLYKSVTDGVLVDKAQSDKTLSDLIDRMALPKDDPNYLAPDNPAAIWKLRADHQLDDTDLGLALKMQKGMADQGVKQVAEARKNFFDGFKMSFGDHTGAATPAGTQGLADAKQEAIRQEAVLSAHGKDPNSLYDRNSPDYFGKRMQEYMPGKDGIYTAPGFHFDSKPLENSATSVQGVINQAQFAEKAIESSGGNYAATGRVVANGDRAYGAYQVMGHNIPKWTQQWYGRALTPEEFRGNKQAQDAVFNGQFGYYLQKYGNINAAARAWYAGEKGMNNFAKTDGGPISVAEYGNRVQASYQGIPYIKQGMKPVDVINKYAGHVVMLADGQIVNVPRGVGPGSR